MKRRLLALFLAFTTIFGALQMMVQPANAATIYLREDYIRVAQKYADQGATNWKNLCLGFVAYCFYEAFGVENTSSCCAYNYGSSHIDSTSKENIPIGADVYFGGSDIKCGSCGQQAGHIGIYVGDGYIIHSWSGKVQKTTIDYVISRGYPYRGYGWHADIELVDGYLSRCSELYPSFSSAVVKNTCNPHPLPCSNTVAQKYGASSPAMTDKALSPGDSLVVNGIIKNTEGHYWYKVTLSDGTPAYVFANECAYYGDFQPYVSGDIVPDSINGATFLGGKVEAPGARINSVQAIIYKGSNLSGEAIIQSDIDYVSTTAGYNLYQSAVDYSLPFQDLEKYGAGSYSIAIRVGLTSYYLTNENELKVSERTTLASWDNFTYGNPGTCSHSYSESVTPPTCTNQGYTTYTCTKCGNSYVGNYVAQTEHEPGYAQEVLAATCTEGGVLYYFCAYCNTHCLTEATGPVGHIYGEWYATDTSTERRDCINCDYYETRSTSCTHSYSYVKTAPTCSQQGYTTYTCTKCGNSYVDNYVGQTGHQYGEWYTYNAGTERRDCQYCSHYETRSTTCDHSYASVETTPTCSQQGYTTYTCTKCGNSYVDNYVGQTGHQYGEWYTYDAGTERRDCQYCSHFETMSTACDHSYTSVEKPSTCTTEGEIIKTCVKCGFSYQHCILGPKGHSMGNWYLAKPATATEDGYEQRNCQNCSHNETRILPATQSPGDSTQPTTPSPSTIKDQLLNNPTVLIVAGCVCMVVVLAIGIAIGKKKK